MQENEDKINERRLLLERLFGVYQPTLLKIGKELGDSYCAQFNDQGFDFVYKRFDGNEVLGRVASLLGDDQLLLCFEGHKAEAQMYWDFLGQYYTFDSATHQLSVESRWVSIEDGLNAAKERHGRAVYAVLKAVYQVSVVERKPYDNWHHIQYLAKEFGCKHWMQALTALERTKIIRRHKGDIAIPPEAESLVLRVLARWESPAQAEEGEESQVSASEVSRSWDRDIAAFKDSAKKGEEKP